MSVRNTKYHIDKSVISQVSCCKWTKYWNVSITAIIFLTGAHFLDFSMLTFSDKIFTLIVFICWFNDKNNICYEEPKANKKNIFNAFHFTIIKYKQFSFQWPHLGSPQLSLSWLPVWPRLGWLPPSYHYQRLSARRPVLSLSTAVIALLDISRQNFRWQDCVCIYLWKTFNSNPEITEAFVMTPCWWRCPPSGSGMTWVNVGQSSHHPGWWHSVPHTLNLRTILMRRKCSHQGHTQTWVGRENYNDHEESFPAWSQSHKVPSCQSHWSVPEVKRNKLN